MKRKLLTGLLMGLMFSLTGQVITDGLIGAYPLDGNAGDSSGLGLHGTVNGATLAVGINGEENTCYDFSTGDIDIFHNITLPDSNVTISAWLYPDTNIVGYRENEFYNLMIDSTDYSFTNWGLKRRNNMFSPACSLIVCSQDYSPCYPFKTSSYNVKSNEWNHVIFQHVPSWTKIYVNSSLVDSLPTRTIDTVIKYHHAMIGRSFKGRIDQLMMFNRPLSSSEINTLYSERKVVTSTSNRLVTQNFNIKYDSNYKKLTISGAVDFIDRVEVLGIDGKIVFSEINVPAARVFDVSKLKTGVYLVKANSCGLFASEKVFINN